VLALRPALTEADRIAVVAFAGEPRVASPLVPASDWDALRGRLLAIDASGGTRITSAVEAAVALFAAPEPEPPPQVKVVRHVVLLSDGHSDDFDIRRLAAEAKAKGLSVSAVATGADADQDRLGRLAAETGGRLYASGDLGRLAETFLKDMAWARGEGLRHESREVRWLKPEPVWTRAGSALPPVEAYDATQPKASADVLWAAASPGGAGAGMAPLLAVWRHGMGKTAAMPWPVSAAGNEWMQSGRLGDHLASVLAWVIAEPVPAEWSARLVDHDDGWWVRVEDRTEKFGQAPLEAAIFAAAAEPIMRTLAQVAPGIYETRIGPRGESAATLVVVHRPDDAATASLAVPGLAAREFERFGTDMASLEAITRAGGGRVLTTPDELAEIVRQTETRGYMLAGLYLVWLAGAVIVLQTILRLVGKG